MTRTTISGTPRGALPVKRALAGSKCSQPGKALPSAILASRATVARASACWKVSLGKVKLKAEPVDTVVASKLRTLMKPPVPEALPLAALLDELSALEAETRASPALFRFTGTGVALDVAVAGVAAEVAVGITVDVPAGVTATLVVAGASVLGAATVPVLAAVLPVALAGLLPTAIEVPVGAAAGIEVEVGVGVNVELEVTDATGVEAGVLAMSTGVDVLAITATGAGGVGTDTGGITTDATDGGKGATVDGTGLMSALVDVSDTT